MPTSFSGGRTAAKRRWMLYGINDPSDLPTEHLAWMRALPLQVRDEHRLFVHAGVRPGVPLKAQSKGRHVVDT